MIEPQTEQVGASSTVDAAANSSFCCGSGSI